MPDRRTLLKLFLDTSVGASLVTMLYPVVRFLVPPKVPEAPVLSTVAVQSNQLPPNFGKVFKFGTQPGIVIRTPSGELKAFTAVCTHLDCTVQYRADLQHIWCACHDGHYDLNGINIAGPPPRPLTQYEVDERNGEIVVSKAG